MGDWNTKPDKICGACSIPILSHGNFSPTKHMCLWCVCVFGQIPQSRIRTKFLGELLCCCSMLYFDIGKFVKLVLKIALLISSLVVSELHLISVICCISNPGTSWLWVGAKVAIKWYPSAKDIWPIGAMGLVNLLVPTFPIKINANVGRYTSPMDPMGEDYDSTELYSFCKTHTSVEWPNLDLPDNPSINTP